ncbi:hypothetical protein GOEFS_105_00110 [Gordonia effusa NBRC 100432]|uniref:DNA-binding protein n=1 Tax=Gordonia effusa NBRC 100432 TaxID=1077974 RepID=H0R4J9_9ACTN|nr:hypothetical protein [Gordonia effusa]GAB20000.1 hypothetical protein GOEFS_105_00110 [Gordonia effusa NBRC 100432]
MTSAESLDARAQFRSGAISFEDALGRLSRFPLTREQLADVLDNLSDDNSPSPAALSEADAAALDSAGFVERPGALTTASVARDIQMQQLVAESLTVNDAADRAGVSTARIRQRLAARTLWAYKWGTRRLLIPAQFTDDGVIPGIEAVVARVRPDAHPLEVQSLLTLPQPTLAVDGEPASIVAWLLSGPRSADEIERATDIVDAASWGAV